MTVTEADGDAPEAPDHICTVPNQGRPTFAWRNDPRAQWYNIWIGGENGTVLFDWFSKPDAIFADSNADQVICEGLTCTFKPDINPLAGDYSIWLRAWGTPTDSVDDGEFSTGGAGVALGADGWNGGETEEASGFSYPDAESGPITPLTPTIVDGEVTLRWSGVQRSTWYNIWLGTNGDATPPWQPSAYLWVLAENVGCENGGTCTLDADSDVFDLLNDGSSFELSAGEYIWYIQSWGPGGFGKGDDFTDADLIPWTEAPTFSVP